MTPRESHPPEHVRGQPWQVQMAVLYERVQNLDEDVKSLRRTLWVFITAIVSGAVLFLFSVASGWLTHTGGGKALGFLGQLLAAMWEFVTAPFGGVVL